MEIPTSFIGYKKEVVNEIIKEKDNKLSVQQKDIDYLRKQVTDLEKTSKKLAKISVKNSSKN